ncbi:hypothetical protein BR1R3_46810 [Pseudomonas atacamensis]|nr:hypothetical protein BR1R3_46810 [Pseudomonas atacamensis]
MQFSGMCGAKQATLGVSDHLYDVIISDGNILAMLQGFDTQCYGLIETLL